MTALPTTAGEQEIPGRAISPALSEFGYWMTHYRRTWRGTIVISVLNPLLFFLASVSVSAG